MPIVPRAQRQVETRPLAGPQIQPRGLEQALAPRPVAPDLGGVQKIIEEERYKADQVAVLEADNKLSERGVELQRQALDSQGKDAMGATAAVREQWDQTVSELEPELTSDRAKMMFRQRALARWSNLHSTVEAHASSEARKFDTEQTTQALENRHNDALRDYRDPARVGAALAESDAILRDFGRRHGLSDELVAGRIQAAHSAVHVGILDRMLSVGDDRAATAYFQEHKAEIAGDKLADVEKALQVGSTLGQAQRNSDEILFGKKPASSRKEAYERAREIQDPKERQATEQRLDTEFARRDRDERDAYEALLGRAQELVAAGQMPGADILGRLKLSHQNQIRGAHNRQVTGQTVHTDRATLYELMQQAGSTDPAVRKKFGELELTDYLDKLSSADFKMLTNKQLEIRQGKPVTPELQAFITGSTLLRGALKGTKLKEGTPEYVDLVDKLYQAQQQELEGTGKKQLTPEQTTKIVDRLVTSHFYVDKLGPDPAYRGAQLDKLSPDERGKLYVPLTDIPAKELEAMRKRAKTLGFEDPLDRDLERAWAAALQGNLADVDRALRGGH